MSDIRIVTPDSEEWPRGFADMFPTDRPRRLWVRGDGDLGRLTDKSIAIIGARASTAYGDRVASDIAYGLASEGFTIVSGGAFGIDAAAHRGTIVTHPVGAICGERGKTIVVLACGVDMVYPASHRDLFDSILRAGGLLVSEYEPGSHPHRQRFLDRNRIIAAISHGMVMVEAGVTSGSMNVFRWAGGLGRKLMVVPGPVTSAMSKGTNQQLARPDVMPVGTADEVMDVMMS